MSATKLQAYVALIVVMVATAHLVDGAVTCGQVASSVAPCVNYIRGNAGAGNIVKILEFLRRQRSLVVAVIESEKSASESDMQGEKRRRGFS
ncbi:Non-specific lipid-transfer protein [Linum perenne]